jgi:glucan phosphoethanolaminetransferase (alkaline phosphatase superfamily)
MEGIRKAFRCDPLPWTLLYVGIMLGLGMRFIISPIECQEGNMTVLGISLPALNSWTTLFSILAAIVLPIWSRRIITDIGILDFNERFSLYPMGLFFITSLLSCQSLVWIVIVALLIYLFGLIANLKESDSLASASFKAGMTISVCTFFSPYFLILLLFLWPGLSILRTINWKSIVWALIGLGVPYYLLLSLSYVITGQAHMEILPSLETVESAGNARGGLIPTLFILFVIALTFLQITRSLRSSRKGVVLKRKILRIGILFLAICLILSLILFQFGQVTPYLGLLSLPISIMFIEFFKEEKKKYESILFIVWIVITYLYIWKM